jgi:hypothetical protein
MCPVRMLVQMYYICVLILVICVLTGASGIAHTFVCKHDADKARELARVIAGIYIYIYIYIYRYIYIYVCMYIYMYV